METVKAYHGTCYDIDQFSISEFMGVNTCNNAGAIYFTTDKNVAMAYSRGSYCNTHEWEDKYCNDYNQLQEDAEEQQHVYSADIDLSNVLDLDIKTVYNQWFYERERRTDILDSHLICHIVNILQNRAYQRFFETYDETTDCIACEYLTPYLTEYDEEQEEYIDKDVYYDCIRIKNAVDSIDDESHYIPSDIIIVLDESIIKNKTLDKELD